MPLTYSIDKAQRLVRTSGSETVTFNETKSHQDSLLADPDFNPHFDQLIDLTSVTTLSISFEEARMLARRNLFSSKSRRAFVSPAAAILGMERFMEALVSQGATQTDVFADAPRALAWLGLSPSYR